MKKIMKKVMIIFGCLAAVVFIALNIMMVSKVSNYIHRGFDFDTAVEWAIADIDELLGINEEELKTDDVIIYEMTNKNIDVVACTALK